MRSSYPSPEDYRVIYARYYQGRCVKELCAHLGSVKDMYCLDLCAGEGLATEYFISHGATKVWSVDEAVLMSAELAKRCPQADMKCANIEETLLLAQEDKMQFDRVVCRQGVNYWLTQPKVHLLGRCMKSDGIFVFNTLNTRPPTEPRCRTYTIDGRAYAEIAYSMGDVIHTIVACEGYEPHQSEILWLSRESLHSWLEPYFNVVEHVDGNSSVYVCTKF